MKRDARQVVHELAAHYGIASQSQDPEPQRNVVLYRGALAMTRPQVPNPTLMEFVQKMRRQMRASD